MQALHSTWSKPRTSSGGEFYIEDFDLLSTILSALKWREKNGTIKMVTDSVGYEFYKSRGMCNIWNGITTELDGISTDIDPETFWAAGKLFALKNNDAPVAVIDTDFIVWDRLAFDKLPDLTVIHKEELYSDIYPDISEFKMKRGFVFDPNLDWHINPVNSAFYVIKNTTLKQLYVNQALLFMENADGRDPVTYMVFAEQRLLAMCARMSGIEIKELSSLTRLFEDGERYFTHIWGMKEQMRKSDTLRRDFCLRCINRIKTDFPDFSDNLSKIPELESYL